MPVLDDLSGFEFEDVMEDVFRNLGYEKVRQAERTADEGRDILMEEVVDGTHRAVVVECKHTGTVGRPVVQKLHSAIATFEFGGPKRGMVVTTGLFTGPPIEYAERLRGNGDPYPIELIDGGDLREIADDIGLDLYNGRIEILGDETLRPYDPATAVAAPVTAAFRDIDNIDSAVLHEPYSEVTFRPVVAVTADTNAVFEMSVGVVHRINDRSRFVVHAERGQPPTASSDVSTLVVENLNATVALDTDRFETEFDTIEERRFGQTQTSTRSGQSNGSAIITRRPSPTRAITGFPCGASRVRMAIATGDSVTLEYTGRLDDDTVFDTSRESVAEETGLAEGQPDREYAPLTVEIGDEQIIEGKEGLIGLEAGETEILTIPPEKVYGEPSDDQIQEFETEELKEMLGGQTPEEGAYLEAQNGGQGEVVHVDAEVVRVDFNPRLAGETLIFDIEIIDIN